MRIFSIGHSNQSIESFFGLLEKHLVTRVLDVRSRPHSRWPHFNVKALRTYLQNRGVDYSHNSLLGGREGLAPAVLKAEIEAMVHCIEDGEALALMCSEGDPLQCHRSYLIGPVLHKRGVEYVHILRNGQLVLFRPGESTPLSVAKKVRKRVPGKPDPQRPLF